MIERLREKMWNEVRAFTHATRIAIGFNDRDAWRHAPAHFDSHTLEIEGHPVMEDWEEPYMELLAEIAASKGGLVLEVGFGMGISARHLQARSPDRHIIIEANRDVYAKLRDFARMRPTVEPRFGFWEDIVPTIRPGTVSGILFDTYPLSEDEIHENHFPFFTEAYRLLSPGGVLTYYSDEIDSFSPRHLDALGTAGFTDIDSVVCPVTPPPDCAYWKSDTLLAPIVRK